MVQALAVPLRIQRGFDEPIHRFDASLRFNRLVGLSVTPAVVRAHMLIAYAGTTLLATVSRSVKSAVGRLSAFSQWSKRAR